VLVHAPPPHGSPLGGDTGAHRSEEEGPHAHRLEKEPLLGHAIVHTLPSPLLLIVGEEPAAASI
jgi:hypothetical protein